MFEIESHILDIIDRLYRACIACVIDGGRVNTSVAAVNAVGDEKAVLVLVLNRFNNQRVVLFVAYCEEYGVAGTYCGGKMPCGVDRVTVVRAVVLPEPRRRQSRHQEQQPQEPMPDAIYMFFVFH